MHQDLENSTPIPPPKVPSGPKLADLFGMADARAWAEALARDFALWRLGKISWSDTDHACVLHGPPGTGKTTLGRAVAARLNVPHIEASFATWQGAPGGHLGTTIEAMQQTFALARQHKPCVITVDELDSIPARSAGGHNPTYFNSVTNAMLTELDVAMKVEGVIIIGTCNHPEMLDPALVRPGRMDRLIAVHLPNAEELKGILLFHLTAAEKSILDAPYGGYLQEIAALCTGFSGADVEQAVRGARRLARTKSTSLSLAHFEDVLDPPAQRLSASHRRRIATHEAGHAVAAWILLHPTEIAASIVSRGGTAGRVTLRTSPGPRTRHTVESYIVYQLAGRAAEQLVLGDVSDLSGGSNKHSDLAQATRLATEAVLMLGFSADRRLVWTGDVKDLSVWREDGPIARELTRILDEGFAYALSVIGDARSKLEQIAEALLERRVLSHNEIKAIMQGGSLPRPAPRLPAPPMQSLPCLTWHATPPCQDETLVPRALKRMEGYVSPGFAAPHAPTPERTPPPPAPPRSPHGRQPPHPFASPYQHQHQAFEPYGIPYGGPPEPAGPPYGQHPYPAPNFDPRSAEPQAAAQQPPFPRARRRSEVEDAEEVSDDLGSKVRNAFRRLGRLGK